MNKILKLTWLKGIVTAILIIILYLSSKKFIMIGIGSQPTMLYILIIIFYLLLIYFIVMIIYTILYKLTKKEKVKIVRRKIKK